MAVLLLLMIRQLFVLNDARAKTPVIPTPVITSSSSSYIAAHHRAAGYAQNDQAIYAIYVRDVLLSHISPSGRALCCYISPEIQDIGWTQHYLSSR